MSYAGKADLTIVVKDRLGEPVSELEIAVKGLPLATTDENGKVIFEKKAKAGKRYKIKIEETPVYKVYNQKRTLTLAENNTIEILIGWRYGKWFELANESWGKEVKTMDSLSLTRDYREYDSCDDENGNRLLVEASFPIDGTLLMGYIQDNVVYPETSVDMDEQGKVYASFLVGIDGKISDVKIERGVSKALDRETKRVISSMPRWIPGTCNGKRVITRCRLPIVFTLT
ncbi:MAG: hypothetical protein Crog4KO_04730 [Crocinitomicaceae bacterium]